MSQARPLDECVERAAAHIAADAALPSACAGCHPDNALLALFAKEAKEHFKVRPRRVQMSCCSSKLCWDAAARQCTFVSPGQAPSSASIAFEPFLAFITVSAAEIWGFLQQN